MNTTVSYRQKATIFFVNLIFQSVAHSNTPYSPFEIQKLQVVLNCSWWLPLYKSLTKRQFVLTYTIRQTEIPALPDSRIKNTSTYEGWNFNSGNYLFITDTK